MERLNYHHLLYFYTVAHEGSVAQASLRLGLKQPTVSAQIHSLEEKLGRKLLERNGRGLKVTPAGETVLRYAESIFALGGELLSKIDDCPQQAPKLAVGVSACLSPNLVATLLQSVFEMNPRPALTIVDGTTEILASQLTSRLLQSVLEMNPRPALTIVDGTAEILASQLTSRLLQFALVDELPSSGGLRSRVLLECAVEVFAPSGVARKLRKDFPERLADVPILMPLGGALRHEVESWLASRKQCVHMLAEMPHPEMYACSAGAAIFAPAFARASLKQSHDLLPVGGLEGSIWRMFALTAGKSSKHPALDAVTRAAKAFH